MMSIYRYGAADLAAFLFEIAGLNGPLHVKANAVYEGRLKFDVDEIERLMKFDEIF